MPMLIPDHKAVPRTIQNITKNGIDIDAVVRSSFSCAIRNNFMNRIPKHATEKVLNNRTNNNNNNNNKLILQTKKVTDTDSINNSNNHNNKIILSTQNKPCSFMSQKHSNNKPLHCTANVMRNISQQMLHNNKNNKDICINKKIKKEDNENSGLDDSLTSLQWLKDVKVQDLMEGKPIHYAPLSPAPSNEDDDERTSRLSSRLYSDSSVDYRVNSHVKPPYSYAALIIMAMKSTPCGKMTLSEIYKWITDNFVFYRKAEPSWQNSIRHNLSLNKCFAKLPRNKGDPGKGGYWKVVPEHADKLLETNIRKRRSSMIDYSCQEFIKRQKLELFESQLLMKIKDEVRSNACEENARLLSTNTLHQSNYKSIYKHATAPQHQETLADVEQCRMDHPYGKNPYVKFISDEDGIKALADNLQKTSNAFNDVIPSSSSASSFNFDLSNSQVFNTFSSVIRTDCIWSSEQNQNDNALTESMSRVKEELLEARNLTTNEDDTLLSKHLTNSLNSSGGFTTLEFCLSPPLSGTEDTLSADDLDDDLDSPFEGLDLTVHGTSMQILNLTDETVATDGVKEEPLSPESIDLCTEE